MGQRRPLMSELSRPDAAVAQQIDAVHAPRAANLDIGEPLHSGPIAGGITDQADLVLVNCSHSSLQTIRVRVLVLPSGTPDSRRGNSAGPLQRQVRQRAGGRSSRQRAYADGTQAR